MVFSSIIFLYCFLPIVFITYFLLPNKFRNFVLLISSLFFYFCGEPRYVVLLIFSGIFNYYIGKVIEKKEDAKQRKLLLVFSIIVNFGILFYFKYFNFFLDNLRIIFPSLSFSISVIMPIGISFFTFQAASYVIDIYRREVKSADNVFSFLTYLSLFPQLIAGPIVRYETVQEELKERTCNFSLFSSGVKRFIIGLSKKVLLANVLGSFSFILFSLENMSVVSYWGKALSDCLQLYLDFSGYSDMAIGLGLMFGFKFLENFNYPLISTSITEFWRRWHISLSSWFRDYVYIPLGGSRVSSFRRYFNILVVWMATGFWHGADWNFILWGLYFALFLIIEKRFYLSFLEKHKLIGFIYTFLLVVVGFVIFNQTSISNIIVFLKSMFGLNNIPFINLETWYYVKNYFGVFIFSMIFSTPIASILVSKIKKSNKFGKIFNVVEPVIYILLLILCTAFIIDESFQPFLYFRF